MSVKQSADCENADICFHFPEHKLSKLDFNIPYLISVVDLDLMI